MRKKEKKTHKYFCLVWVLLKKQDNCECYLQWYHLECCTSKGHYIKNALGIAYIERYHIKTRGHVKVTSHHKSAILLQECLK